ncbi:MAG: MBL fold metallo-hydrolase [Nannocystaceae bacterium]|nr:MBL fold metallo-hydrolase [Nannocystaceae bacterium]
MIARPLARLSSVLAMSAALGCRTPAATTPHASETAARETAARETTAPQAVTGPRVRVLGIAQDGGLPHAGCSCDRCVAAARDPARASFVSSAAVIVPAPQHDAVFVLDATVDFREQLALLRDVRDDPPGGVDRAPLDGVLLTHAHVGHYLGLAFLGFEAIATRELPVFATPRLATYLRDNGPWAQLVAQRNITLVETTPGTASPLAADVSATPWRVPHRDEYSDTVAYELAGPHHRVLFLPDTAPWRRWDSDPLPLFDRVDVALVDGTFYAADELPGRNLDDIGHPLMVETMDLLQSRVDAGRLAVWFIHVNHSNPALEPDSAARREIERRGFALATTGLELAL